MLPSGCFQGSSPDCPAMCPQGSAQEYDGVGGFICAYCPAGSYSSDGYMCRPCQGGAASTKAGSTFCPTCPAHTYPVRGQTACVPCNFASTGGNPTLASYYTSGQLCKPVQCPASTAAWAHGLGCVAATTNGRLCELAPTNKCGAVRGTAAAGAVLQLTSANRTAPSCKQGVAQLARYLSICW